MVASDLVVSVRTVGCLQFSSVYLFVTVVLMFVLGSSNAPWLSIKVAFTQLKDS